MQLTETKLHHYEGNWKTVANNGHVYQGPLFLDFASDGSARGVYQFAGNDFRITLYLHPE